MADVPSEDFAYSAEALKLLLQVAAANNHVHPKERDFLSKLAKAWKVLPTLEGLFDHLDHGKPLPQPNLLLLRARPDKVLRAAEALVAVDGEIDADEDEMLAQVKMFLGC